MELYQQQQQQEDEVVQDPPKKNGSRLKKNPNAPRRFKSPYIIFSISRMQEYRNEDSTVKVTSLSSRISEDWKALSEDQRGFWKKQADLDKLRYNAEKSAYNGPWHVISKKRPTKDPSAPRRPPSAFLNYCKLRRRQLSKQNPGKKNTDISKMLGQEWKDASEDIKRPYLEKELRERDEYHREMKVWRAERAIQQQKEDEYKKKQVLASLSQEHGYHPAGHILGFEQGVLQSPMAESGGVTPHDHGGGNYQDSNDTNLISKITPSPEPRRVIAAHHNQSSTTDVMPTLAFSVETGIDWKMFASTSMSLKPVPIAPAAALPMPSTQVAVGDRTFLQIAPRKVTLDVDGSSSYDADKHQGVRANSLPAGENGRAVSDGYSSGWNKTQHGTDQKTTAKGGINALQQPPRASALSTEPTGDVSDERSIIPYRPLDPMIAALGAGPPAPAPSDSICYEEDNDIPILMPYGQSTDDIQHDNVGGASLPSITEGQQFDDYLRRSSQADGEDSSSDEVLFFPKFLDDICDPPLNEDDSSSPIVSLSSTSTLRSSTT